MQQYHENFNAGKNFLLHISVYQNILESLLF